MDQAPALVLFAVVSPLVGILLGGLALYLVLRTRSMVSTDLKRMVDHIEASSVPQVQATLEQFEVELTARIQKVERAFLALGEEVTEALDKAQQFDRSASAKQSRARALEKQRHAREDEEVRRPEAPQVPYWADPTLTREQKLDLARQEIASRRG